ncbi:hypothetical protein [Dyadobacter frigoris]|uniref:Uncharacterized protein n=1 Tax=Dyadobacter frigoris TaxID=2576211 RepID=A0A4U6CN51_9BACT|nr:hypothetical protein [Dyadobacter frigoris]TKT84897.1 hypothetical protein FDK13_34600 [Dyadobacter frigoris]
MHITDSHDQQIKVTDLPEAIRQAALFKQYRHKDAKSGKRDDELQFYWKDLHIKLLKLQSESDHIYSKNEPNVTFKQ